MVSLIGNVVEDWNRYRTFLLLARAGTLSAAAESHTLRESIAG